MVKEFLKRILPKKLLVYKRQMHNIKIMQKAFNYDFNRYIEYSRTRGNNTSGKMISEIITIYHVIEKGLTMPEPRLGFGKERIVQLCNLCNKHIEKYGINEEQLKHAIQVILEYEDFHHNKEFKLNEAVIKPIKELKERVISITPSSQQIITKKEFFNFSQAGFLKFSNSRSSVRNFSPGSIKTEIMLEVLEIARNTPSACNRQSWRTYLITDKNQILKILEVQGGNRGFGHLVNNLVIVTGELGVFSGITERNQVYIDGGIYAMNLLYALHYKEIGACILNCSHLPEEDIVLRELCKIKDSEVFIVMVACGIPPDSFMFTNSFRYPINKTNTII
jgi:nitroreductase